MLLAQTGAAPWLESSRHAAIGRTRFHRGPAEPTALERSGDDGR